MNNIPWPDEYKVENMQHKNEIPDDVGFKEPPPVFIQKPFQPKKVQYTSIVACVMYITPVGSVCHLRDSVCYGNNSVQTHATPMLHVYP